MRVLAGLFGMILLLAFLATSINAMQMMMLMEEQSPDGEKIGSHTILADIVNGINLEFKDDDQHGGITWSKTKNIAWVMDFVEGTYWAMTEADAAKVKKMHQEVMPKMKAQQEKMKEMFEEQMKDLSEEEKKAAMQHLPGVMGPGEEEEIVWEKTGTETVEPWGNADVYIGRQHGDMVEKVWTVGWKQLGVSQDHLRVFTDFGEFAGGFMDGDEGDQPFKLGQIDEQQGYPGLAVKKEIYDDYGELEAIEIVKSVETQESDPAKYQLPTTDPPLEETESPFDQMPTDMPGMPGF
ncbi:hypothetical protein ACFL0G_06215 [Candidatus Zixiibacteriota bacterium]